MVINSFAPAKPDLKATPTPAGKEVHLKTSTGKAAHFARAEELFSSARFDFDCMTPSEAEESLRVARFNIASHPAAALCAHQNLEAQSVLNLLQ